jgi:hypothetical protein
MPTHRKHPHHQQNPIRFKNLARTAVEQLRDAEGITPDQVSAIEKELDNLESDREFWNHRTDGMAWLYRDGKSYLFDFQREVPERVVVADSLHIKPLIRIVQSAERYHVLALTRHSAKMFAGTRDALDAVEIPAVPATMQDALGEEVTEPHLGAASYGGVGQTMFHGHGGKEAEVDKDRDRYFRMVAEAVEKHWSNPSQQPLVLVALDENHAPYHRVSDDRFLLDQGVRKDPESMSHDALRAATWEVVRQYFDQQVREDVERLGNAQASRKGSDVVSDIAREAAIGRVELLLLEEGARLPGHIDWETGEITEAELNNSAVDDVMDDVAEMVIARGGTVRILRPDSLQNESKIGAIYRY